MQMNFYLNTVLKCPDLTYSIQVHCGGHTASSCEECSQGKGQSWCNGECFWHNNKCQKRAGMEQNN